MIASSLEVSCYLMGRLLGTFWRFLVGRSETFAPEDGSLDESLGR